MAKPTSKALVEPLPQIAALPLRVVAGRMEVCLVTTRETRRWTIPKGWPMKGIPDRRAAAIEAEQEAGLLGKASKMPIGGYEYWKRRLDRFDLVHVAVYRLKVRTVLPVWKEMAQREVRWMSIDDAVTAVDDPGLKTILRAMGTAAEG